MRTFTTPLACTAILISVLSLQAQQTAPKPPQPSPTSQPKTSVPAPALAQRAPDTTPANAAPAQPASGRSDQQAQAKSPSKTDDAAPPSAAGAAAGRQPLLAQRDPDGLSKSERPGVIEAAKKNAHQQTAKALEGRKVRGRDDKSLGRLKDFVIDPRTSEVCYGVVSSGGIVHRGRLTLVPFKALRPSSSRDDEFIVSLDEAEWTNLGALDESEFEAGHISLPVSERREIARHFEQPRIPHVVPTNDESDDYSVYLVCAAMLRGRDVYLDEKRLGKIDDIVIAQPGATAFALLTPSWRLSDANEKFLVPLNRYALGEGKNDRVTITITQADFDRMRSLTHEGEPVIASATKPAAAEQAATQANKLAPSAPAAATSTEKTPAGATNVAGGGVSPAKAPSVAAETKQPMPSQSPQSQASPAPTGKTSAEQQPSAPARSLAAAKAVRAAFDQDAAAAKIEVDVNAANESIVLRGTVPDAEAKKSIEAKAAQTAKGAKIDSQITVEKRP